MMPDPEQDAKLVLDFLAWYRVMLREGHIQVDAHAIKWSRLPRQPNGSTTTDAHVYQAALRLYAYTRDKEKS